MKLAYATMALFIIWFVTIGGIRYAEPVAPGQEFDLLVNVNNYGRTMREYVNEEVVSTRTIRPAYHNVQVKAMILDNGEIYTSRSFDMKGGSTQPAWVFVEAPETLSDDAWIRVTVSDDEGNKRVKHIPLVW